MKMSPENWETVKALFESALKLSPAEIPAFLRENCADPRLRDEVERLLTDYRRAGNFLSTPIFDSSARESDPSPTRFRPGEFLAGRFKIICFIAAGGMGEVYEVEDLDLRERLAIKTIRPEILRQANAVARFKREVQLARMVTHPNVCRIFEFFHHKPEGSHANEETMFISMELLQGKTLSERLRESGRMSVKEALPLVAQMASALGAAHEAQVVHRDFKPGNVVLVASEERATVRVVVTDFGLARPAAYSATGPLTRSDELFGTPEYMAPEQLEGGVASPASDIYALGLVIYEMLTGRLPFEGDTPISAAVKRLQAPPPSPRNFQPGLSVRCAEVILRCLERDPVKRFTKAQDVARALAGEETELASLPANRDQSTKPRAQLWGGLAGLALVVVTSVFLFYRSALSPPSRTDAEIARSIQAAFAADPELSKCRLEARSLNGIVILTGLINNESDRGMAARIAGQEASVKQVDANGLVIKGRSTPPGILETVDIPGNQPWTRTDIVLQPGDVVTVSASGGVSFSRGSAPSPPAGYKPDCFTTATGPYGWRASPYVANDLPCTSLLGRIGESGQVFYIGDHANFKSTVHGQLYFGVNDNAFWDNSGSWTANVTVQRDPPEEGATPFFVPILADSNQTFAPGYSATGDFVFTNGYIYLQTDAVVSFSFTVAEGQIQTVAYGIPAGHVVNNAPVEVWVDRFKVATITEGMGGYGVGTSTTLMLWRKSLGPGDHVLTLKSTGRSVNVYGFWFSSKPAVRTTSTTSQTDDTRSSPVASGQPAVIKAVIQSGTALQLPPGRLYLYGMATGGAAPSSPFTAGQYAQVFDAAGHLAAALAYGPSDQNTYTTGTSYHVIGGVSIAGSWDNFNAFYGLNSQSGASTVSVNFTVPSTSLVVLMGLAASQQSIVLEGIPDLKIDASSSGPSASEGMVIAHAYLKPGAYAVTERSVALSAGQDPQHMADLIGVFLFGSNMTSQTPQEQTLRLFDPIIDRTIGKVFLNGVDSAGPTTPFRFEWGDGTTSVGFFPQTKIYSEVGRRYTIRVISTYQDGSHATATTLVNLQ